MAVWTNSAKRFYAHQLEVAVEVLDVCADVVRELVHQIEPFWIIVVLGHQPQLAVHKGATDVVFVRVVKPTRLGDVARRFVSRCGGNIMAFQSDAIHVAMLRVLHTYRETGLMASRND